VRGSFAAPRLTMTNDGFPTAHAVGYFLALLRSWLLRLHRPTRTWKRPADRRAPRCADSRVSAL